MLNDDRAAFTNKYLEKKYQREQARMAQYPGEAVRAISRVETVSGGCHKS